ncbi:hypothetical protein LY632_04865 [Erythrobacter sp. SDW2]|uniref:hypothetical protein n=1 Tax=Erythrobacter sp. SDW2 TaxID=2907154 RepID=UPI001F255D48|nr:hypothetical protein [Erythrobacter sp. SDW2]UIP07733.1 hypothetical protein LY632_04865 [Erythrobacter sp. SDW2]
MTVLTIAGIAACISGALTGTAVGSSAMQYRTAYDFELPQPQPQPQPQPISDVAGSAEVQPPLPDHYPIETPSGRYEVYELSARGLYANRYPDFPEPVFAQREEAVLEAQPAPAVEAAVYADSPSLDEPLLSPRPELTTVTVSRGTETTVATVEPEPDAERRSSPRALLAKPQ